MAQGFRRAGVQASAKEAPYSVLPEDYDFESHRELVPMQLGDVPITYADSKALEDDYGFRPTIGIREGLGKLADWYNEYSNSQK